MDNHSNTSFDNCIKCSICNLYCPVYRVTDLYPGPKHSGPDAERVRMKQTIPADDSLAYCTNCKRCEIACPSGVAITDMITRSKLKSGKHKNIIRDFVLSHTDFMGSIATKVSPLLNFSTSLKGVKKVMEMSLGVSAKRELPAYTSGKFKPRKKTNAAKNESVIFYLGCYSKYNYHKTAEAVLKILDRLEIHAEFVNEKCCGVPLIANNFRDKAVKNARHNMDVLATTDLPILVASPSCYLTLKHEYETALGLDNSVIRDRLVFITEYLNDKMDRLIPLLKKSTDRIAYHAPCHLEKTGRAIDTIQFLQKIPGLEVNVMNSECCGISGTFGFKKENYDIAQNVGQKLFSQIAEISPDLAITDCETCKMQIEMSTEYSVLHPVEILANLLE